MAKITGNKALSKEVRGLEDHQSTPIILETLMRHAPLPQIVWEPAAGLGNLVTVLRNSGRTCYATDINPAYAAMHGHMAVDFLEAQLPKGPPPTAIVTNGPFSKIALFAQKAMDMGLEAYLLGRLNYYEGGERDPVKDLVFERQSGLNAVYVFRERVKGLHRTGYDGPKGNPMQTLCWYHWIPGFKGEHKLRRISQLRKGPLLAPPRPKELRNRCRDTVEMFATEDA